MADPEPPRRRIVIETDWEPWGPAQREVLAAPEDEVDATLGRRCGKTTVLKAWLTGVWEGATWGAVHTPGGRFWYCAPTLRPACKDFYRELKATLGDLVKQKNDTDLALTLFNGALIECKSLEDADNLRGPGLDGLGIDEKGTVSSYAWYEVLSPMLADPPERCRRRVMRCGTPRGKRHWTYREHLASSEAKRGPGGRAAFRFPTWTRPGLRGFCDRARLYMPRNAFDQEYGAEFLDAAAGYFQKISEAHDGASAPAGPDATARYTAGLDFAHVDDWEVCVVLQASPRPMRVVAVERASRVPWPLAKGRAIETFRRWGVVTAMVDATPSGAPGEVTVEAFKPEWTQIEGFDFRSQKAGREDLLANLAVLIETGELVLPGTYERPAFPQLTAELEGFQYEILPSGRPRARAGPGLNDDCVMALALAAWAAKRLTSGYAASRRTI